MRFVGFVEVGNPTWASGCAVA